MARTFTGNGHDSLVLKKEGWDKLFGERYGGLIFKRFLFFRITSNRRIQSGPTSDTSIGFLSYFLSFIPEGLFTTKRHSQSTGTEISQLLSTSSAMVPSTTSPPQNRSTRILPWDQHRKAGYQTLGMQAREQDNDQESRIRRPFHQDMD